MNPITIFVELTDYYIKGYAEYLADFFYKRYGFPLRIAHSQYSVEDILNIYKTTGNLIWRAGSYEPKPITIMLNPMSIEDYIHETEVFRFPFNEKLNKEHYIIKFKF